MQRKVHAVGRTDIGRVRSTNQDSMLVENETGLFVVADGMGGHAGGEIASRICIEQVKREVASKIDPELVQSVKSHPDPALLQALANSINYASARIYEHSLEDPSLRGMGTTATVVKIVEDYAYCAHVGDSRFYLVRSGFIYQLTFDHSLVNEQVRAGILTPEEAEVHHLKNVITRSVGYQEEEDVDTLCVQLEKGDLLVLCSDGLHGKINDAELSQIANKRGTASVAELVDLANDRGGEDNITLIMAEVR
ncbi:MAG: Stp1/IreP family PP2C-type Ser/Thr phosphatase [Pseudobdellovibrionaceae bacterium]|uniref:Stp1/IreP family PP2C-type Ser/Thr phosphatase n=1 Tax=Oligoflexus sp. TaxID=1971216 RepID=UPI0027C404F7|nr:Stp1/IreP family PP2C-type Ser/Thr phosphatase [Oligoflexus sp.]MDQ3235882.1 Stp1/IreP family PP2C-type Ser/Thr phosphatase [Pseudobdellovibrionaceae bacterium]HYX38289.1 Stp1/IreP family PP2C-type Ser/Thr phosphatase [Oligoflexus sp.]